MGSFESRGYRFEIDRSGVQIEDADRIEIDIEYEAFGIDPAKGPQEMGARLTQLLGETVEDEEGIFDLAVSIGGQTVAALVVACESDAVALGGERVSSLSDEELADALTDALGTEA